VDGVTPYLTGQPAAYAGLQELSKEDLAQAEKTGFPIVALILLAVFGSAAAASLPLALGLFSVLITGALIYLLSQQTDMSILAVCVACGFESPSHFSRTYRARFHTSPRQDRSALRTVLPARLAAA